jgi:ABC-type antimicrobial peptide transport system permease subunit
VDRVKLALAAKDFRRISFLSLDARRPMQENGCLVSDSGDRLGRKK